MIEYYWLYSRRAERSQSSAFELRGWAWCGKMPRMQLGKHRGGSVAQRTHVNSLHNQKLRIIHAKWWLRNSPQNILLVKLSVSGGCMPIPPVFIYVIAAMQVSSFPYFSLGFIPPTFYPHSLTHAISFNKCDDFFSFSQKLRGVTLQMFHSQSFHTDISIWRHILSKCVIMVRTLKMLKPQVSHINVYVAVWT